MNSEVTSKKASKELESKIESKLSEKNDYVLFKNMNAEEIRKLDRVRIEIVKNKNKKGNIYYQITVKFSDRLLVTVLNVTSTLYYLIIDRLKLEDKVGIHTLISYCRVLKGQKEESEEWARFELFITDEVKIKQFFSNSEWALFKKEIMRGALKISVVDSEAKLSEDEVDDMFDLAFN